MNPTPQRLFLRTLASSAKPRRTLGQSKRSVEAAFSDPFTTQQKSTAGGMPLQSLARNLLQEGEVLAKENVVRPLALNPSKAMSLNAQANDFILSTDRRTRNRLLNDSAV